MADITSISAELRDRAGKGAARAVRRAGRVPGVIYGDKQEPTLISVDPKEFARAVQKPGFFARLAEVKIGDTTHRTLPRDVQFHPITDTALHVDFMRVGAETRLTVAVPVIFENQDKAPGLKRGGILNVVRHEIELYCSAANIPDHVTVNLEGVDIGDSVHVSRVALPEGTKPVIARDFTIATVAPPTVVREELAAQAAAAAAGPAEAAPAAAPTGGAAGAKSGS